MGRKINIARAAVATLAAASLVAGIALAGARADGGAEIAKAKFDVNAVGAPDKRVCHGPDGRYETTRATYRGPITGRPSVLNGDLRLKLRILINLDKSLGFMTGTWAILDPSTDAKQASGDRPGGDPQRSRPRRLRQR